MKQQTDFPPVQFQTYHVSTKTGEVHMSSQIEKLEAHASHLLDAFIGLRERYSMLHPMLFQEEVPKQRGSGRHARGFKILRNSLFLSCAQDIAKLSMDDDKRTPSLRNFVAALTDDDLRNMLRERFSLWRMPSIEEETDPEIVAALRRMEEREEAERRVQFDNLYCEATVAWASLSTSAAMKGFLTIRDKVSAHTEVRYVADKYQFIDIGALGIMWGDLKSTIETMQRLVELIGFIVRNAGFAWDMLDEQLSKASAAFWTEPSVGGRGDS